MSAARRVPGADPVTHGPRAPHRGRQPGGVPLRAVRRRHARRDRLIPVHGNTEPSSTPRCPTRTREGRRQPAAREALDDARRRAGGGINFTWLPYSPSWAILVIAIDVLASGLSPRPARRLRLPPPPHRWVHRSADSAASSTGFGIRQLGTHSGGIGPVPVRAGQRRQRSGRVARPYRDARHD